MRASELALVAVGDALMLHPVSPHMGDPASSALLSILASADIAVANCEVNGFDPERCEAIPQAESGGLWLNGGLPTIADLRALGFNMVSRANNHAGDFGVAGLRATSDTLTRHGIVHAGTGETLSSARAPAYLTVRSGRAALLSATTAFPTHSVASHARHDLRGRPGVNAIRTRRVRVVDEGSFRSLQIACDVAEQRGADIGYRVLAHDTVRVLSTNVTRGDTSGSRYILHESDVEENLEAVRAARRSADYVLFALHNHLPNDQSDTAPESICAFARQVVAGGADAVICHGPHRLRAIEIHRGRPIFYSLGHFVCHLPKVGAQPADAYVGLGFDPRTAGMDDLLRKDGFWDRMLADPCWWESVVVRIAYDRGTCRQVELFPIDLCQAATGSQLGTPRMADAAQATRILESLRALSEPFGTRVEIVNGVGLIHPDKR